MNLDLIENVLKILALIGLVSVSRFIIDLLLLIIISPIIASVQKHLKNTFPGVSSFKFPKKDYYLPGEGAGRSLGRSMKAYGIGLQLLAWKKIKNQILGGVSLDETKDAYLARKMFWLYTLYFIHSVVYLIWVFSTIVIVFYLIIWLVR